MPWYGIAHVFSLVYLTFIVALVIGLHEVEEPQQARRHVLGCWARLLGSLVGMMLVVYILSLFSGG